MRYLVTVGGTKVILDQDRLDRMVAALYGADNIVDDYVGANQGDDGGSYRKLLRPYNVQEQLAVNLMADDLYDTMVLRVKLLDEQKSK